MNRGDLLACFLEILWDIFITILFIYSSIYHLFIFYLFVYLFIYLFIYLYIFYSAQMFEKIIKITIQQIVRFGYPNWLSTV